MLSNQQNSIDVNSETYHYFFFVIFKAPYIVFVEVVLCDNVFASPLPIKQNESKLRSTRSEENLAQAPNSSTGNTGTFLNYETQSLDAELIDSYRSNVNSEDADIWSTSDEINSDDHQHIQSVSRRNGLVGYRSHHAIIKASHFDTQSIRSNESHISQQEIMPSDIRKRLTEVQSSGPISFEVISILRK